MRRVYAHLGDVGHRSEAVEFRVAQHLERLGDRQQRLGLAGRLALGTTLRASAGTARKRLTRLRSRQARNFKRAGDRTRTGDVQLGKLAFYH